MTKCRLLSRTLFYMQANNPQVHSESDEITLKELIEKVKSSGQEIKKYWYILVILAIPIMAYQFYAAYKTPITYPATLTFMVNEDTGGGGGMLAGLLGSFGLGGGGGGEQNLLKILELAKSRHIMQEAILTKATIDGSMDYLGNHLIRHMKEQNEWVGAKDTTGLFNFQFLRDSVTKFTKTENRALFVVCNKLTGEGGIFGSANNKETGIMTFSITTTSEELSIELLKTIYDKLGSYYIDKSTEKQRITYDLLRNKTDSIRSLLGGKEYAKASFDDSNLGLQFAAPKVTGQRLDRDVKMLQVVYGEAIKNLEMADFALKNKTPFIQAIDLPVAPLKKVKKSKLKGLLTGLSIGILLGSVFVVGRKIIRNAMM